MLSEEKLLASDPIRHMNWLRPNLTVGSVPRADVFSIP